MCVQATIGSLPTDLVEEALGHSDSSAASRVIKLERLKREEQLIKEEQNLEAAAAAPATAAAAAPAAAGPTAVLDTVDATQRKIITEVKEVRR